MEKEAVATHFSILGIRYDRERDRHKWFLECEIHYTMHTLCFFVNPFYWTGAVVSNSIIESAIA
jgi:hypothetical protein